MDVAEQQRIMVRWYIFVCFPSSRDSSAVRRLFVWLAGAVGRQSALHKENSGFSSPTPCLHISMFGGYQIFIFYPKPLYKSLHQSFFYSFIIILLSLSNICHVTSRKLWLLQCILGFDDLHISSSYLVRNEREGGGNVTHALSEACR